MTKVGKLKTPTLLQVTGESPRCQRCDKPLTACTFRFREAGHLDHAPTADAEADKDGRLVAFYWGHYIDKGEPRALDIAVAIFCRKLIAFHGLTYDQGRGAP